MPTGYTSRVLKDASFEDFALDTASAFSYLARSINETGNLHAPLPDPAKADRNGYHEQQLAKAQKSLKSTLKMSFARAAKKARQEFDSEKQRITSSLAETAVNGYKLNLMVKQVLEYRPPDTESHRAHKAYMLEQLKTTIEHDANPKYYVERLAELKLLTPQEWKEETVKRARHDIAYHNENLAKDRTRLQGDVDFLANLRTAVKAVPKPR